MKTEITGKAYSEILKALRQHKDLIVFDIEDFERKSDMHLFGLKLKEQYGLDIDPKGIYSLSWQKFGDHKAIGWWGEKYSRRISWSDDGSQPEDELLLQICFPCGAYTFGDDYPTDLFQRFFLELKSFGAKYIDSVNQALYFTMENAKDVFNSFDSILKKYWEINKVEREQRRIAQLKAELEKLENTALNK